MGLFTSSSSGDGFTKGESEVLLCFLFRLLSQGKACAGRITSPSARAFYMESLAVPSMPSTVNISDLS
jgi:hypothetical protein